MSSDNHAVSVLDLIKHTRSVGSLSAISNALYAHIKCGGHKPVRNKMLLDALAFIEAVQEDIAEDVKDYAVAINTAIGLGSDLADNDQGYLDQ